VAGASFLEMRWVVMRSSVAVPSFSSKRGLGALGQRA
jgi:hypothetical protein